MPRAICDRCRRPQRVCLCGLTQPVPHKTPVVVLQDAQERRHPFGTVRLLQLMLSNMTVIPVWEGKPVARPTELPDNTALLMPRPESRPLSEVSLEGVLGALVVLDGTWPHARRIYHEHRWVQSLPCVHLEGVEVTRYGLRKAPAPGWLCTLEAVASALEVLEPESGCKAPLMGALEGMVQLQRSLERGR